MESRHRQPISIEYNFLPSVYNNVERLDHLILVVVDAALLVCQLKEILLMSSAREFPTLEIEDNKAGSQNSVIFR